MRKLRLVLGVALLAAAAAAGVAPGADAATLAKTGWWWRVNDPALPGTLPPSPAVPEGALMVGGAPDGATAMAAIAFDLAPGEGQPVLTLDVERESGGATAVLAACVTGSAWSAASSGAWADKPFPACDEGSVSGVRSDDGASWSFALAPLQSGDLLDVVLVAGTVPDLPDGANGSTFEIVFAAPTTASLVTASGTAAEGPSISAPDFAAPPSVAGDGGSFAPPSGGSFAVPEATGGFTPSLPDEEQGLTATAPVAQQQNPPLPAAAPASESDGSARALAGVILALGGAAMLWSSRSPLAALGAAPQGVPAEPGGLGRFARPRAGPVPRL